MSTKTTFKRVALGTVAAVAASLLTVVVSAPSASAAVAGGYEITGLGSAVDGNCFVYASANDVAAVNFNLKKTVTIGVASVANNRIDTATTNSVKVAVASGPAIITKASAAAAGAAYDEVAAGSLAADGSSYTFTGNATRGTSAGAVDITLTGLGTVVVKTSQTTSSGTTFLDTFTISSVASCDAGTFSAANSSSELVNSTATASAQDTDGDETGANLQTYADDAFIKLWLADKYGTKLTDTGKYLTASATNGAFVAWAGGTPASATAVLTSSIGDATLTVKNGGVTAPVTTVVTISLNGTVVATKTITFTGYANKIVIGTVPTHVATNTANADAQSISYTVTDSAGNRVAATAVAGSSTANTNAGAATNFYTTAAGTTGGGTTTTAAGYFDITGGAAEGASVTTIRVALPDGTYAVSPEIKYFTSTATTDKITVSTDKKTYAPGEVVTVTVKGVNAAGNPVADGTVIATTTLTVVKSGLTAVSSEPAAADKSVSGAWTYKFYASTTPAAYGISVKSDKPATTTGAVEATFTVATSDNSEIAQLVKVISSLLTTFTKQITALIKALGKR